MPMKSIVLSIEGVQVKKVLIEETATNASVGYAFRSDRSHPMRVRVLEPLPKSVTVAGIGFLQSNAEINWQPVNDHVLAYTDTIDPGTRVKTEFFIETPVCNVYAFDRPPFVETVEPITGRMRDHTPDSSDQESHRQEKTYQCNGLSIDSYEDTFTSISEKFAKMDRNVDFSPRDGHCG